MPLLNYTTTISVDKTVGEVQRLLAKAGATAILSEYDDHSNVRSISFKMKLDDGEVGFRLPVEPEKVLQVLKAQRGVAPKYRNIEQARRIAWRIIKDWVEAQLAIIATRMVKAEQIFLPYAITQTGETLYEQVINNKFLLLGGK